MFTSVFHSRDLEQSILDAVTEMIPGEWERCESHYRLHHHEALEGELLARLRTRFPFDINPLPTGLDPETIRLLITDMDSTLINIECIDEIADFAGVKAQVAAITESAMRGEIDFATSLTQRVAALEGLDESVLARVYEERLSPNPGAEKLVAGLKERDIKVALVSGGFTFFTDRLKQRLGLDFARANQLEKAEHRLTGRVLGAIVDAEAKAEFLYELCSRLGIEPSQSIAMGDGANDLKMMQAAGLSVAYRAKPKVQAAADVAINHSGLDAVLQLLERGA